MKKWQIKNFWLNQNPIKAETKKEAYTKISKLIRDGKFEFDVEESN